MKRNSKSAASRVVAGLLLPAILSMSAMQAAEAVTWPDLPRKIGRGKLLPDMQEDRQYSIKTKSGKIHRGRKLIFSPVSVSFADSGASIPREQVTEIRIHHHGSWTAASFVPADKMVGDGSVFLTPLVFPLIPLLIGVTLAAVPFAVATEGVRRLLPSKTVQIAP